MSFDLQLRDYETGYRFRVKCRPCGYGWYEEPAELLARRDMRPTLYLDEIGHRLTCPRCRRKDTALTPIRLMPQHHFVGGMA